MLTFPELVELFKAVRRKEEGQTMAEYAVVLAVVTLLVVFAITFLSTQISTAISKVAGII